MLTEEEMKDPIRVQAANDTCELMLKMGSVVEEYFQKESVIPHNQKFLVINRAVGGHATIWFNHFLREMDPANKIEKNDKKLYRADDDHCTGDRECV